MRAYAGTVCEPVHRQPRNAAGAARGGVHRREPVVGGGEQRRDERRDCLIADRLVGQRLELVEALLPRNSVPRPPPHWKLSLSRAIRSPAKRLEAAWGCACAS